MNAIIDTKAFRMLMGLCLFMQALALMPHHHHGGNETPCLDITHCIGYDGGCETEDACAHGEHEHNGHSHGTKDGKCSFDGLESLRADREETSRTNLLAGNYLLLYNVFTVGSEEDPCGHCHLDEILDLSIKLNRGIPDAHTAYIATALPPRAPSFTV